jgi:hypothetical protein
MLIKKFKGSFPGSKRLPAAISASANAKTIVGVVFNGSDPDSNQGVLLVGLTVKQIRHDGPLLHLDTKPAVRRCELETTTHKLRQL